MARRSIGSHGKPCMRQNGKVMMTIRPEPSILNDTDLAMLIGHRLEIKHPYWDEEQMTADKAVHMIWKYENENQRLTKKHALELVSDAWYLENYHQGSDTHEMFSKNEEHHLVLLQLVHRIWPEFKESYRSE